MAQLEPSQHSSIHDSFKVFVRVRPVNQREQQLQFSEDYLSHKENEIALKTKHQNHVFTFDRVYSDEATQKQIFDTVASDIIDNAFLGINGTIFCYGQTSSGKTHTIVGDYEQESLNQGLAPRVLNEVFQRRKTKVSNGAETNLDIRIKLTMVEIYNQKVCDLFDLNKKDLKLRENKKKGVFIENVTEQYVASVNEGLELLKLGLENRTVKCTNLNAYSSRSHMVFVVTIYETNFQTKEAKSAKITLTDLAGSQKVSKTGVQGKMLIEAKKINTSLSTLGKVINALSDNKSQHIPYRDSKLTRLLQESIGGNSLTRLIVNVSPSAINEYQTITSLRFGSRAKLIKNKPKVNKEYTIEELLALLEKAELKIKQQCKIIEDYEKGSSVGRLQNGQKTGSINGGMGSMRGPRRNGGYAMKCSRAITMHMIGDDDQWDEEENSSIESRSIAGSVLSHQDACSIDEGSLKHQQNFSSTVGFEFDGAKPIGSARSQRKPALHSSKSMKSILTMAQKSEGLEKNRQEQSQLQGVNANVDDQPLKMSPCSGNSQFYEEEENLLDCEIHDQQIDPSSKKVSQFHHSGSGKCVTIQQHEFRQKQSSLLSLHQNNSVIYEENEECNISLGASSSMKGSQTLNPNLILGLDSVKDQEQEGELLEHEYEHECSSKVITKTSSQENASLVDQAVKFILQGKNSKDGEGSPVLIALKQRLKQQLKEEVRSQIEEEVKQQISQKFEAEVKELEQRASTIAVELEQTQTKLADVQLKYEETVAHLQQQRQTIKAKEQHIVELKEKYRAKKSKINREINNLKTFWQSSNI